MVFGRELRTGLFWLITQRVMVIFSDVSGQHIGPFGFLTPADGADSLS